MTRFSTRELNLSSKTWSHDFYRATRMRSADYAVARCLSVCLSHAGIVPKRLHISSKFFHLRVAHHFSFFIPNGMAIFRRELPPNGASNARGYEKSLFSTYIGLYLGTDAR